MNEEEIDAGPRLPAAALKHNKPKASTPRPRDQRVAQSIKSLAEQLGVTSKSIHLWCKEAAAPKPDGSGEHNVELWRRFLVARGSVESVTQEFQTWRKIKLDADLRQQSLDRLAGKLVVAVEVEAAWRDQLVSLREALLALPGRLGAGLAACSDQRQCEQLLRDEINLALGALST